MNTKDRIKILLIGDNSKELFNIENILQNKNFHITKRRHGKLSLKEGLTNKYKIIILILETTKRKELVDNIHFFKKTGSSTPLILIFDVITEEELLRTYEDDVVLHKLPVRKQLLLLQINKLLKDTLVSEDIRIGNILLKPKEGRFYINKKEIYLTETEFNFFLFLIKHKGEIVTRGNVIRSIMNYNRDICECAVDTMVSRIRKKIGDSNKEIIKTVNGKGYRLGNKYKQ